MSGSRFSGALIAATAAATACTDPELPTDLKGSGPPDVTAVLIASDLRTSVDPDFPNSPFDLDRLLETATHCRLDDKRRPAVVNLPTIATYQVCPDDLAAPAEQAGVAQAAPPAWYVRVVFDELLDPDIEDIVPGPMGDPTGTLRNTQPVELTCDGAAVPYDGYYVPNGNRISWPVGPALYIQPLDPASVATGAACTVTLRDRVTNKRGEPVPADQRSYGFVVADMALRFADPPLITNVIDDPLPPTPRAGDQPVRFFFTAAVGSLPPASAVHVFAGRNLDDDTPDLAVCDDGGAAVPPASLRLAVADAVDDTDPATTTDLIITLGLADGPWAPGTTYRVEVAGTDVAPAQGGAPARLPDYASCFYTPSE